LLKILLLHCFQQWLQHFCIGVDGWMILLAEFMVRWKQKVPVVVSDGLDTCWYDIDGAKGWKVYGSNYVTINLTMVTMILFIVSLHTKTQQKVMTIY
jgi:hypothetical protein